MIKLIFLIVVTVSSVQAQDVTKEALDSFKQSALYDPDAGSALTQFLNATNSGKIDASSGLPVQPDKVDPVEPAQDGEVAVIPADTTEDPGLKIGDLAPSWALMSGPGKFEFLKTWTEERGKRLRKPSTQPIRHVVLMSFFATWCKPCMKELPHLQNLYEKYKDGPIKFFLIDITEATRTVKGWEDSPKAGPFLEKKGITIPILYDSRAVAKERYGAKTLPRLYIVDKYRIIQLAKIGFHEDEDFEGELSEVIERLTAVE